MPQQFFIPFANDSTEAEIQYRKIRRTVEENFTAGSGKVTDRRIFSIHYRHNGKNYAAQVGGVDDGGVVLAILEQQDYPLYFIYIDNRGPALVGGTEVISTIDFDG